MEKDKKIIIGIICLLLLFVFFVGILALKNQNDINSNPSNSDAINFKNEYEKYNNILNEEDNNTLKELSIKENNPVDIIDEEEALDIIKNKTGLIYMGVPSEQLSRVFAPILLQTLDNMGIDILYYLNIDDIRDTLKLNGKKIETITTGTENYYEMLDLLKDYIPKYYLINDNGKKVDTKERRIYAPLLVAIKDGEVVGAYNMTLEDPYEDISKEQEAEISNNIIDLVNLVYDLNCDETC